MTDVSLLAYVPDPFAVQTSRFLIRKPSGECLHVNARELSDFPTRLLTYDLPALIDDLRRLKHTPPIHILDIGDALRLLVGRPKDEGGEKLWNVWPALKRHFADKVDADLFERLALSRENRPSPDELSRLLEAAGEALAELWESLATRLKHHGEYDRLTTVERVIEGLRQARVPALGEACGQPRRFFLFGVVVDVEVRRLEHRKVEPYVLDLVAAEVLCVGLPGGDSRCQQRAAESRRQPRRRH